MKRATPYSSFITFDAPNPERTCVRRVRSNTPLQALTMLNDAVFVECAKALAKRLLEQTHSTNEERMQEAWLRVMGHPASDEALKTIFAFLETEMSHLENQPDSVKALTGQEEVTEQNREWAGWILVCRALLNLDETITKS